MQGAAWRSAAVGAAVIAFILAAPGAAQATHLGCGAIVSADATLDSDLIDCPGNGVEIPLRTSRSIWVATRSTAPGQGWES